MNRSIGLKWRLIIYYHYHSFTCLLFKAFEPFHNIYSRIDWKQKKTSFENSFHCFAWIQTLCIDWKDNHYLWIKEFFSHPFPFRINYLVAIFKTNLKQFSYLNVGWRCWMVMNIQFIHLNKYPPIQLMVMMLMCQPRNNSKSSSNPKDIKISISNIKRASLWPNLVFAFIVKCILSIHKVISLKLAWNCFAIRLEWWRRRKNTHTAARQRQFKMYVNLLRKFSVKAW